jgi:hypothetical protein
MTEAMMADNSNERVTVVQIRCCGLSETKGWSTQPNHQLKIKKIVIL